MEKGSILIISSTIVYCNEICNEVNRPRFLITPICALRCEKNYFINNLTLDNIEVSPEIQQ